MSEWKETELGQIANVQTGPFGSQLKNEQYITGGTPVVTVEHIKDFRITDFDFPSITNEDKERLSKYLMKTGDILFTRVGSVDLSAYVSERQNGWMFSSRMLRVRPNEEINSRFLSYYFQQKSFRDYILNISVGATMPSINTGILKGIPISYPPLPEQTAIASVLSSLDDKIDLLHRQNATLEKMAETLFRQWFVEEANIEWEETSLVKHTEAFRGLSYKGSGLTEFGLGLPMHNLNSVYEGGGYKYEGIKFYNGEFRERHLINPGDIIVTNTEQGHEFRLIGFPAIVPEYYGVKGLFSQHIYKLIPLEVSYLSNEFIYYLLMTPAVREQITAATNGSTVNMLAIDGLQRPVFKLPPKELVQKFTSIVSNFWKKKNINQTQIRTLTALRDTLLPKLMSGEVRVNIKEIITT